MPKKVTYEELKALLANKEGLILIDVRSHGEVQGGCIPGAIHIPLDTLEFALQLDPLEFKAKFGVEKPAPDVPHLVFYCQSGMRGEKACRTALKKGYINACNYAGAYSEWSRKQR